MSTLTITVSYSAGSLVVQETSQTIQITTPVQTQVVQLGSLSAAVNQQITQAVSSATASASQAAASATASANAYSAIANGTATDAGTLTGNETLPMSRAAGLLQKSLNAIANFVLSMFGVSSVASLKALNTVFFTRAKTGGYTTIGDGGFGEYYFVQTSSPPADNGVTVLRSNDGRGYWALMHNGVLDVKQAGAQAGVDCSAAVSAAIAAIIASNGAISKLVFSAVSGGWQFSNQVLFNASGITYEFFADLYNTSTAYKTPFVFAYDGNAQPAQSLADVVIVGNGHKWHQNGKAAAIAAGYGPTVAPTTYPQNMFNYIDRLRVGNIRFDDGMYDSFNARQCRAHVVENCEFSNAYILAANGHNIVTDWTTYVQGDFSTYSHGVTRNCVAFGNAGIGMTYYNACGGEFVACKSYKNNNSGFSYEAPPGQSGVKDASGRFIGCESFLNGINGWYVTMSGVQIDQSCKSYGNGTLGLAADTSGLQCCGVVVSSADNVEVHGRHESNARQGVTFLGSTGNAYNWKASGTYINNAGSAINAIGVATFKVLPGTICQNNAQTSISGTIQNCINVSNASYNSGAGTVEIAGVLFQNSGGRDINVTNVRTARISITDSLNNNYSRTSTGGQGHFYGALTNLFLHDNFQDVTSGNQYTTLAYYINNDVSSAWSYNNKSNQATGTVVTNNASTKWGIMGGARIAVGTYTTETTLPSTGTATLSDVTNVLSTLITELKDGVMQA